MHAAVLLLRSCSALAAHIACVATLHGTVDTADIGPLLVILPIISSFLFPTLASTLVDERRERLYLMMRIEGVRGIS